MRAGAGDFWADAETAVEAGDFVADVAWDVLVEIDMIWWMVLVHTHVCGGAHAVGAAVGEVGLA